MKTFSLLLLSLFLTFEVLSAQDICDGRPLQIKQSLYLNKELFLFIESGAVYRVNGFQWNDMNDDLLPGKAEQISLADDWTTAFGNASLDFSLTVDYPQGAPRLLIFHWIDPLNGSSLEGWIKQVVGNQNLTVESIDIRQCYLSSTSKWCSLFTKHWTTFDDTKQNLKAMLSTPLDTNRTLSSGIIQYSLNNSNSNLGKNLTDDLYYRDLYYDSGREWEWWMGVADWTSVDLAADFVAVSALTGNRGSARLEFDIIDFVHNQFQISRINEYTSWAGVTQLRSGDITELIGCPSTEPQFPEEERTLCDEFIANFEIIDAIRWNNVLFLLLSNYHRYRINSFKWDGQDLTVGTIDHEPNWGILFGRTRLMFSIMDPAKGPKVALINWNEDTTNIPSFSGKLIGFDEGMANKTSEESLQLNIYKCDPNSDRMRLCSLFAKFPDDNIGNQLMSISSFPHSDPFLPPRVFVYYKETPPKNSANVCPDCYKLKRHLFVSRNQTISNFTEPFWMVDNATQAVCVDLNDVVNASTSLTDYIPESGGLYFDLIEFLGYDYRVIRVSILNDSNVSESVKTLKSGKFKDIFDCKEPQPLPPNEESPNGTAATDGPIGPDHQPDDNLNPQPPSDNPPTEPEPKKSSFTLWMIIILVFFVLLLVALLIWFLCYRQKDVPPEQPIESGPAPPSDAPAPAPIPVAKPVSSTQPSIDTKESDSKPTTDPSTQKVSTAPKPPTGSESSAPPQKQVNLEFPEEPKGDDLKMTSPSVTSVESVRSEISSQPSNE